MYISLKTCYLHMWKIRHHILLDHLINNYTPKVKWIFTSQIFTEPEANNCFSKITSRDDYQWEKIAIIHKNGNIYRTRVGRFVLTLAVITEVIIASIIRFLQWEHRKLYNHLSNFSNIRLLMQYLCISLRTSYLHMWKEHIWQHLIIYNCQRNTCVSLKTYYLCMLREHHIFGNT